MQTRRDQLQGYRFVTRRIVSAMLSGEPETSERPMRRYGLAVFGSAMLATIIFAGVGVVGFLFPSGVKLPDPSIVIERETGARYVFLGGELHPVLNFASARLVLGTEDPEVVRVSQRSLRGYVRGRAVGIANLPDPLPDRADLTTDPWSVCSLRRSPGSSEFVTHLVIGDAPAGGEPLGEQALLIEERRSTNTRLFLLINGRRHPLGSTALAALGLAAAPHVKVTSSLVEGIPPGPKLDLPTIAGIGKVGPTVDGEPGRIGQVYLAAGQHYVLLSTGLATIGPIMQRLLLVGDTDVTSISVNAAQKARSKVTPDFDAPGLPTRVPELADDNAEPAMVCAVADPRIANRDATPSIMLFPRLPADTVTVPAPARVGPDGVRLADRVVIPGGRAAVVRTLPAPGDTTPNTTTYLVTDQGVKYALPRVDTAQVLASLGYAGIAPTPMPTFLLALLPIGPTFDPVAAKRYVVDEIAPTPTRTATPTRSP